VTDPDIDTTARAEEQRRLKRVLKEIEVQIEDALAEVAKDKAVVTGTQSYISDEYYSVPKSFAQLVDLAGGMGMLRLAGKMYRFTLARLKQLERLSRSAYFGRIDFLEATRRDRAARPIYIGVSSLMGKATGEHLVFDWRAPISSVYYDYELGRAQYESPGGVVEGEVTLKRHFKIQGDEIILMYDNNLTIFDEILQDTLGKAAGERMKSIVNTIQREQNKVIRDESRGVLLVQGCAGSGKTSIALHRAAYLLYKHRQDMSAENILMITPNRIFEDYTSTVLPELGEEPLRQVSFADLARDVLRLRQEDSTAEGATAPEDHPFPSVRLEEFADQLEYVLEFRNRAARNPAEQRLSEPAYAARTRGIRLKSSSAFAWALRAYADRISGANYRFGDLVYRGKILVSGTEVASLIGKEYSYLPMVKRIEKAKRRMTWILDQVQTARIAELQAEIAADPDNAHLFKRDIKEKAASRAYEELKPLREKIVSWAPVDYFSTYRRLYAEKGLLEEVLGAVAPGDGDNPGASRDSLAAICRDTVERLDSGVIPFEDVAPLAYLKGMLEGLEERPQIRHVIVDEAQDYSALQFRVLRMAFPRALFTVLGDMNQTIGPAERGNEDYEAAVTGLEAGRGTQFVRLEKSYRSTREITEFTHAMLRGGQPVEAIERPGERPRIIKCRGRDSLAEAIAADIRQLQSEGFGSIAVICRTARESWSAFETLRPLLTPVPSANGAPRRTGGIRLVTKEQRKFIRGTLVIPSYLTKGLEFEAVIIYDAGAGSYSHPDDRLLLYTACTRALHKLHIYHTGETSPLLSDIDSSLYEAVAYDSLQDGGKGSGQRDDR
jgi:DNA helicase-2/ATP-dependent DNA helicase PcrA